MAAALGLAERGMGRTGNNPSVGCILVQDGVVIGRGWTRPGGRPHAEAMALEQAGPNAKGATAYITLEPCAHQSERGANCSSLLLEAGIARVIIAIEDPDSRTAGSGLVRLRDAGIECEVGICEMQARHALAGFFSRIVHRRPCVTLKLATSLDGMIAMADSTSRWITGEAARAHVHLERARSDAILVGAGTYRTDNPGLDVRLPGLQDRSPRRLVLGSGDPPAGWEIIHSPGEIATLDCNNLLVEGGAMTASAFLKAQLVDRLLLYRAPILIGAGISCLRDIGLGALDTAHGQWRLSETRMLGKDRLEVYERHNRQEARA